MKTSTRFGKTVTWNRVLDSVKLLYDEIMNSMILWLLYVTIDYIKFVLINKIDYVNVN